MNTPRRHSHKRGFLVAIAVAIPAMLIDSGLSAPPAQAGYIVTLAQVGSNVVASGSGTLDLAGLSKLGSGGNAPAQMNPSAGFIDTGPATTGVSVDVYTGFTGPTSFGSGTITVASTGSGDVVELFGSRVGNVTNDLIVPSGYASDAPLSDTSTYDSKTLASLGATPGTYEWTWGSGANQNFTLQIGTVPAPLIGRGLPVLLAVGGLLFGAKLLERGKRHRLQFD